MGYNLAKRFSKDPDSFGKGRIEGVFAPETAAHASGTSALLPMLALGIPGSGTAAILLGGLMVWGLNPGPLLFVDHKDFVWGLIASMYLGNIVGLVLVLTTVPIFASILRVPFAAVAPMIVVSCAIGAYAIQNAMFDIWLMLLFGVAGYVFKKISIPLAPFTLALVLGSKAEDAFRLSMIGSGGDMRVFWSNWLVGSITTIAIVLLFWPADRQGDLGHGAVARAGKNIRSEFPLNRLFRRKPAGSMGSLEGELFPPVKRRVTIISRCDIGATASRDFNSIATLSTSLSYDLRWFATFRGRVGLFATPETLLYATGGLAVGELKYSAATNLGVQVFGPGLAERRLTGVAFTLPVGPAASNSDTRAGWTAGAGVEHKFTPNWSGKLEYLSMDFGTKTFFAGTANQADVGFHDHILRAGINYEFRAGPVVAKY